MNLQPPIVSVLIPAYNAAKRLGATLESVRAQTFRSFEALVVDDGSIDDTRAVVEPFLRRDPRFRLLRQANRGVGEARNAAIREARGRYLAPLDADDLWHPEKLAKQVACFEQGDPGIALVYCWSRKVNEQGRVLGLSPPYRVEGYHPRAMILRNFVGNASVPLIRASALHEAGLYLTRAEQGGAQGCEDWDVHMRLAERHPVGVVAEYLTDYRQAAGCMSVDAAGMAASGAFVLQRARRRNPDLPNALFRWSAGHFFSYLVQKCYQWRNYTGALQSLRLAIACDPATLINAQFYRLGLRSTVHLLARGAYRLSPGASSAPARRPGLRPPSTTARRPSLFNRIESRRWASALAAVDREHAPAVHPAGLTLGKLLPPFSF